MKSTALTLLAMMIAIQFMFSLIGLELMGIIFMCAFSLWFRKKDNLIVWIFSWITSIPALGKMYVGYGSWGWAVIQGIYWGIPLSLAVLIVGAWIFKRFVHLKERVGKVI